MILLKRHYGKIRPIFIVHIFNCPLFIFSKNETLESWHNWLLSNRSRTWNVAPVFQIVQKIPENYCSCLYLSIGQVWWLNELRYIFKDAPSLMDVADLVNHDLVENTKNWMSWKLNILFPRNKKILNLCLRWHIFRSYCFLAEVIFKVKVKSADFIQYNIFLVYLDGTSSLPQNW